MRVGHVGAGHPDHIQEAGRDRMTRGRHVGDLGRVERRHSGRFAHFPSEVEVRGVAHPLDRDQVRHRGVGVDAALHDVEEVDHPAIGEALGNLDPFVEINAALFDLVGGVADADDKLVSDPLADAR